MNRNDQSVERRIARRCGRTGRPLSAPRLLSRSDRGTPNTLRHLIWWPQAVRRRRDGIRARHHLRCSLNPREEDLPMRAGTLGDAVYGESVAGSPPPDCSNRAMRSLTSRSHLSRSTLPSQ